MLKKIDLKMVKAITSICPTINSMDGIGHVISSAHNYYAKMKGFKSSIISKTNYSIDTLFINNCIDLISSKTFTNSDVVIYHYGHAHNFFDAFIIKNPSIKKVINFHNVTPPTSASNESSLKDWSVYLSQVNSFHYADEIWCDSNENATALISLGVPTDLIKIIPLSTKPTSHCRLAGKSKLEPRLISVGRLVPSKNYKDTIEAIKILSELGENISLKIFYNKKTSDAEYVKFIKNYIRTLSVEKLVTLNEDVPDSILFQHFGESHILISTSAHEGFGLTVHEAIQHGCIPITYQGTNLDYVNNGLGITTVANPIEISQSIRATVKSIRKGSVDWDSELLQLDGGSFSLNQFDKATSIFTTINNLNLRNKKTLERLKSLTS